MTSEHFKPPYIKPKEIKRPPVVFGYAVETPLSMVCQGWATTMGLSFHKDRAHFCTACFFFRGVHYHLLLGLEEEDSLFVNLATAFTDPFVFVEKIEDMWVEMNDFDRSLYKIEE